MLQQIRIDLFRPASAGFERTFFKPLHTLESKGDTEAMKLGIGVSEPVS